MAHFRPDAVINRAQFAAMVAAAFKDRPKGRAATRFVDVPDNHWASNAITQAQRQGFLSGFPDQTFRPDQPMARVQALVAVAQGLQLPPAPANVLTIYRDRGANSQLWHRRDGRRNPAKAGGKPSPWGSTPTARADDAG